MFVVCMRMLFGVVVFAVSDVGYLYTSSKGG